MHPCSHRKLLQNTHASKNAHPFQDYVYLIIKGYKAECVCPRLKEVIQFTFFQSTHGISGLLQVFQGKKQNLFN